MTVTLTYLKSMHEGKSQRFNEKVARKQPQFFEIPLRCTVVNLSFFSEIFQSTAEGIHLGLEPVFNFLPMIFHPVNTTLYVLQWFLCRAQGTHCIFVLIDKILELFKRWKDRVKNLFHPMISHMASLVYLTKLLRKRRSTCNDIIFGNTDILG